MDRESNGFELGSGLRILLYQEDMPHYRVPLFDRIAESDFCESLVVVSSGSTPELHGSRRGFRTVGKPAGRRVGPFVWQSDRSLKSLGIDAPDVVVLDGNTRYIATYRQLIESRRRHIASVWWGIGVMPFQRRWTLELRIKAMSMADSVLLYADADVDALAERGLPHSRVVGLQNTIDERAVKNCRLDWSPDGIEAFSREQSLPRGATLLYTGRLDGKERLDVLIEALAVLERDGWNGVLVCIGDGSKRDDYVELANRLGVRSIRWLGRIDDEAKLAPWFLSASLFVYPGSAGLAVMHAFAYGLPVMTAGGPWRTAESRSIEDGVSGVYYDDGNVLDAGRLAAAILSATGDDASLRRLSEGADATAGRFDIEQTAQRFGLAVEMAWAHCAGRHSDGT